ncbi:RNase P/RNase MRP subunit POP5 [Rhodoligotrophos appendicifer]|uniref:hypothetical protein n=1 Tax=Rhodoligotrophos appendicifer TaxID=987056 RepID=UPI001FE315AA|nr:hypothetical protein [Rhodoligotrophos appendicifer]
MSEEEVVNRAIGNKLCNFTTVCQSCSVRKSNVHVKRGVVTKDQQRQVWRALKLVSEPTQSEITITTSTRFRTDRVYEDAKRLSGLMRKLRITIFVSGVVRENFKKPITGIVTANHQECRNLKLRQAIFQSGIGFNLALIVQGGDKLGHGAPT